MTIIKYCTQAQLMHRIANDHYFESEIIDDKTISLTIYDSIGNKFKHIIKSAKQLYNEMGY